uniref:Retrovirus-related Pol polyprotein from transposon TNT 1-94 n=1 Tax=Cajanus cajan TaxID=3821 RepID=A0A151RXK0_CAJCA|nr:Retrovirus-related Pol polyprotein from transposon TNT 1-94 [Cajanus cajan]
MHDGIIRSLQGVRHMKGLKKNLLSVGQLDDLGCKIHVEGGILKVVKNNLIVMKAEKITVNLYMLLGDTLQEADASVATIKEEEATMMWNYRLGHMSERGLKILVDQNFLSGLKTVNLPFCEHCTISKQHRLKFAKVTARRKHILDLIHSDVWESPEISMGGAKCFVSFINDYSWRLWVYPIKKKSYVFPVFKEFKAQVKLDTGKRIKCLRIDNGGEYIDGDFLAFCKQEGIKRQFTIAHTPGLKQAPRCWYKRFDSFIINLKYNRLSSDHYTYYKRFEKNDFIILLLYVDDMLVVGSNKVRVQELKAQLAREFDMKGLGPANKILGMQIHRDRKNRKIWLSQNNYFQKILRRFNMQDCKPILTPLPVNYKLSSSMCPNNEAERMEMSQVPYASAVGSLMYAMICTRPDIAHAVGAISRFMANPGREH